MPRPRPPSRLTPFVPDLVAALAGIVFLAFTGMTFIETVAARSWHSVPGRIVQSELSRSTKKSSIQYEYEVHGRTLTGTRVSIFQVEGTGFSRSLVGRFPAGGQVTVFYDPANPSDSALDIHPSRWMLVLAGVGLAALAYGLAGFVVATRKRVGRPISV